MNSNNSPSSAGDDYASPGEILFCGAVGMILLILGFCLRDGWPMAIIGGGILAITAAGAGEKLT